MTNKRGKIYVFNDNYSVLLLGSGSWYLWWDVDEMVLSSSGVSSPLWVKIKLKSLIY